MIKKFYASVVFLVVICISSTALFAQEDGSSGASTTSFQILGSLSLGYAGNSDINGLAKDSGNEDAAWFNANIVSANNSFSAENTSANFTYGFDLDLRLFFGSFGIGAEVGYHEAQAKSEVTSTKWANNATTEVTLSVVPVVASLYYMIPMESSRSFLLFGAGAGYYSGKLKFDWVQVAPNDSFVLEGKQSVIGYHALVEYDFVMESGLTFFTGLKARYVKFDKFKDGGDTVKTYSGESLGASLSGINCYFGAGFSI